MRTNGIRIYENKDDAKIKLIDILKEVNNGNLFKWSILYLYSIGDLGEGKSIPVFENQIIKSQNGFLISWEDLLILSTKFEQLFDITIIGSFDEVLLKRFAEDREMYETCDIAIELIDGGFWEVFSKDDHLIQRLAEKFKDTLLLTSDFDKSTI